MLLAQQHSSFTLGKLISGGSLNTLHTDHGMTTLHRGTKPCVFVITFLKCLAGNLTCLWGPVLRREFSKHSLCLCFDLSYTSKQHFRSLKTDLLGNRFQMDIYELYFQFLCLDGQTLRFLETMRQTPTFTFWLGRISVWSIIRKCSCKEWVMSYDRIWGCTLTDWLLDRLYSQCPLVSF